MIPQPNGSVPHALSYRKGGLVIDLNLIPVRLMTSHQLSVLFLRQPFRNMDEIS